MSEDEVSEIARSVAIEVVKELDRRDRIPREEHYNHHQWVGQRIEDERARAIRGLDRRDRITGGLIIGVSAAGLIWIGSKVWAFLDALVALTR